MKNRVTMTLFALLFVACGSAPDPLVGTWKVNDTSLEDAEGIDQQISITFDDANHFTMANSVTPQGGYITWVETATGTYTIESGNKAVLTLTALTAVQRVQGTALSVSNQDDPNNANAPSFCFSPNGTGGSAICEPVTQSVAFNASNANLTLNDIYVYGHLTSEVFTKQ